MPKIDRITGPLTTIKQTLANNLTGYFYFQKLADSKITRVSTEARWHIGMSSASYREDPGSNPGKG